MAISMTRPRRPGQRRKSAAASKADPDGSVPYLTGSAGGLAGTPGYDTASRHPRLDKLSASRAPSCDEEQS
jgi:hypothetical protein